LIDMRRSLSKLLLVAGAAAGLALVGLLVVRASPGTIAAALAGGGWPLVIAVVYRGLPLVLNTLGWRALMPGGAGRPRFRVLLRLRWIGEAVNALLPVAQVGGDLARARLLAAEGMSGSASTAIMVVDITTAAATQVVFTLLGLAALALGAPEALPHLARTGSIVVAAVVSGGSAIALLAVARLGVRRMVEVLPMRARTGRFATRLTTGAAGIDRALTTVLAQRRELAASSLWHLAAWLAQVGETWVVMALLGHHISWVAALAIESLAATARGAAFVVPGGLGVQEGALVLVAGAFGVDLPTALALGLIKRGRELVIGLPAMVAWSLAERHAVGRFLRRRNMDGKGKSRASAAVSSSGARSAGPARLRVGVLVDLHWRPTAGGHVKTWERLAAASAGLDGVQQPGAPPASAAADLDLTVHFLGKADAVHAIGPHVQYRIHKPLISSARVPFLSHVPDHTDLAPYNPRLAALLREYDVIHTTDGTFTSARTAARVARRHQIPLVNSVHTTTPFYTRVFTAATVERLAGKGRLARALLGRWDLAGMAEARMQRRLDDHLRACAFVLASRSDDRLRLAGLLGPERVGLLRRGIDHTLYDPRHRDRAWLEGALGVPRGRRLVISVGRLDGIKNVLVLAQAVRVLLDRGVGVHLLCPGQGADRDAVMALLGEHVTCPGVLDPETLARAYASADVCAQPAVIEELSNAVLEAGSSGLPLLVAESSGSGRFVVDGVTGVVVKSSTASEWAAALEPLLGDAERREGMGRAARQWSLKHVPTWRQVLLEDLLPAWRAAAAGARAAGAPDGEKAERDPSRIAQNQT
jgi:putative membrane protein